jgi:hypothetical protein
MYYIYNTLEELKNIDAIVCKGENIGQNETDVTKQYAEFIKLNNGTFAYICDDITSKYITDREPTNI